jgi:hypothetical protein
LKRALVLLALGACKDSRSLTVTCELDREADRPTKGFVAQGWALHDRETGPTFDGPEVDCEVKGRRGVDLTVEDTNAKLRTSERDGSAQFGFARKALPPGDTELVVHGDGLTARAAIPAALRLEAAGTRDGGVLTVTGKADGATSVTVAGAPVKLDAGAFSTRIEVEPWLLDRLTVADLGREPTRSLSLLVAADDEAFAVVTTPAPPVLDELRAAIAGRMPSARLPAVGAGAGRPAVIVLDDDDGKLVPVDPEQKATTVEVVLHATLEEGNVETCRYVSLTDPSYDEFPVVRRLHSYRVRATAAHDGAAIAEAMIAGAMPAPCPPEIEVPRELDRRVIHGELPTYDQLRAWLGKLTP